MYIGKSMKQFTILEMGGWEGGREEKGESRH